MPCIRQGFYGSAIRGVIPEGWIDASTLREVPDHQELFLSRTSLSSMIVEINRRVSTDQALSALTQRPQSHQPAVTPAGASPSSSSETIDRAATLFHLQDLCDEGDKIEIVVPAEKVLMGKFPSQVPAYRGIVSYITPKLGNGTGRRIPVSVDGAAAGRESAAGAAAGAEMTSKLTCHYLLVRLEKEDTDLLVFMNVPHEEFDGSGDPRGLSREEELAAEVVSELVKTLEVTDWTLFV